MRIFHAIGLVSIGMIFNAVAVVPTSAQHGAGVTVGQMDPGAGMEFGQFGQQGQFGQYGQLTQGSPLIRDLDPFIASQPLTRNPRPNGVDAIIDAQFKSVGLGRYIDMIRSSNRWLPSDFTATGNFNLPLEVREGLRGQIGGPNQQPVHPGVTAGGGGFNTPAMSGVQARSLFNRARQSQKFSDDDDANTSAWGGLCGLAVDDLYYQAYSADDATNNLPIEEAFERSCVETFDPTRVEACIIAADNYFARCFYGGLDWNDLSPQHNAMPVGSISSYGVNGGEAELDRFCSWVNVSQSNENAVVLTAKHCLPKIESVERAGGKKLLLPYVLNARLIHAPGVDRIARFDFEEDAAGQSELENYRASGDWAIFRGELSTEDLWGAAQQFQDGAHLPKSLQVSAPVIGAPTILIGYNQLAELRNDAVERLKALGGETTELGLLRTTRVDSSPNCTIVNEPNDDGLFRHGCQTARGSSGAGILQLLGADCDGDGDENPTTCTGGEWTVVGIHIRGFDLIPEENDTPGYNWGLSVTGSEIMSQLSCVEVGGPHPRYQCY